MAGPSRRRIFVVGLHRSGTSILAQLIAGHPLIAGHQIEGMPAELENEGQHVQVRAHPPNLATIASRTHRTTRMRAFFAC